MSANPFRAVVAAASITGLAGLRAQGVYVDPEAFELALNLVWSMGDDRLQSVPPVAEPRNSSEDGAMTTADVAAVIGITARGVRKAAASSALAGWQDPAGQWWFKPEDVEAWKEAR